MHDIDKNLEIKGLKAKIKANIEDIIDGKKASISLLVDKFAQIMKKKILPLSCEVKYDLLLYANGYPVNEYVKQDFQQAKSVDKLSTGETPRKQKSIDFK